MKPTEPNTKATCSSQRPPSHQQTPVTITIDDESCTESESDQQGNSTVESEPDDYLSAQLPSPPENQLGLEEWDRYRRSLLGIPEVPEPTGESQLFEGTSPTLTPNLDKIDHGEEQESQNKSVGKDNIPVNAEKPEVFLSLNGQVSVFF
jgi:hypothetical protein